MKEETRAKRRAYLEEYLAGRVPLHPERLALPSEEELEAAEAAFDKAVGEHRRRRRIPLWPWAAAAAAVVVLCLFPWEEPTSPAPPVPPAREVVAESKPLRPAKPDEPAGPAKSIKPDMPQKQAKSASSGASRPASRGEERKSEKSSGEVVIPSDRQALVDIYLAEEALQVEYMLREPLEELRAFYASFDEEEPDTTLHIIAI